jgi:hypothetical protein
VCEAVTQVSDCSVCYCVCVDAVCDGVLMWWRPVLLLLLVIVVVFNYYEFVC